MKLYALSVLYKVGDSKATRLVSAHELAGFSFFQRSSVKEFMNFSSKIIVERTMTASRSSVKEQEYICHVYVNSNNVGAVVIADHEYPQRVAHTLLNKVIEEFEAKVDKKHWSIAKEDEIKFPELEQMLQKYQNPREADAMTKINADLDETKIILHSTMEALLERGEKVDELVCRSTELSDTSKMFYKTSVILKASLKKKSRYGFRIKYSKRHNTIEAVLERGEKIDDLVEKSEGLSLQSKTFYKTARKTNSCCVIL